MTGQATCRVCEGPVDVADPDTAVIQEEKLCGYVCGDCMRDDEPSIPTRVWVEIRGSEGPLPPKVKA